MINYRECLQNFPVWSIVSFLQKSFTSNDEFVLSVDGNGSVRKWSLVSKTCNTGKNKKYYSFIKNNTFSVCILCINT